MRTLTFSLVASSWLVAEELIVPTISISASPIHSHQSFEIPAHVNTLDHTQITTAMSGSLGSILDPLVGVNNVSTGSQAGKVVLRGMGGDRIKVTANTQPTDFQTYGIRHIANTEPFLLDQIEVIQGAQGVLYGADALGGVVNLRSADLLVAKEGERKLQGELLAEYHTNNNEYAQGIKLQSALGRWGINVGYIHREGDNIHTPSATTWSVGDPAGTAPRFAGELPYTNFETDSLLGALGYTDDWGYWMIEHVYWESLQNYLGHTSTSPYTALASAGQTLTNHQTQLKGEIALGDWLLKPSLSHTRNQRLAATNVPYEQMNSSNTDLDIEVDRWDGRIALGHPKIGHFEGEIGIEGGHKEQTLHTGSLVPTATEKSMALYLFEEMDHGPWIFQWGVRHDRRAIEVPLENNPLFVSRGILDAHNNTPTFDAFGGSFGVTYRLSEPWRIALNLTQGFRAPSLFELYAGGSHGGVQAYQIGNPNLTEETTQGADLSLRYDDTQTQATLTLYRTYIDNYIYLVNTGYYRDSSGTQYTSSGVGRMVEMTNEQTDAMIQGVELHVKHQWSERWSSEGGIELIRGVDLEHDRSLPMIPSNSLRAKLSYTHGAWAMMRQNRFSLDLKGVDDHAIAGSYEPFAQYSNKTKLPFGSADTAGYMLVGMEYHGQSTLWDHPLELGIKVDNLFDRIYRDFLDTYKGYTVGMGRNITFSMRLAF